MGDVIVIEGKALVDLPRREAYRRLLEPSEQMKWNTLYLDATTEPRGEIREGTVMTGTFKGSGKATVHFERVIPGFEFTHHSRLMLFQVLYLGEFRHTYRVKERDSQTEITQSVRFEPRGLGRLLKNKVAVGFRKRLPESFLEFQAYAVKVPFAKSNSPGMLGD